jgi:hypothetical protein
VTGAPASLRAQIYDPINRKVDKGRRGRGSRIIGVQHRGGKWRWKMGDGREEIGTGLRTPIFHLPSSIPTVRRSSLKEVRTSAFINP